MNKGSNFAALFIVLRVRYRQQPKQSLELKKI